VYYLVPFAIALIGLVLDETYQRRAHLARASAWLGAITQQITPRLLAVATFVTGLVLLLSGATPASPGRLDILDRVLPLGVVEVSHFVGSIAGAGLLVLSHGLSRRLDAAYYLSSALIVVGMVASLLKGFDYEEAALLLAMLLMLHRARPAFDRRAAFFETPFSGAWLAALAGALVASLWLGLFAFKHLDYSHELWWQVELHGEASRFLRASVGAAVVVLIVAFARLIGPAPHETVEPTEADLADVAVAIGTQTATSPNLVFLRDKAVLFNSARDAFVMYGVQGRTWVALGDPVGPDAAMAGLIRGFLERCDDFGGVPAFYEIGSAHLHRYADYGLTFVKLGEEAKVDLTALSLEGGHAARYRQSMRRLEKDGGSFRIIPVDDVPAAMGQLNAVSDDWLRLKAGGEKGFSLGFFDEAYLRRFPVAVVERHGRIQAFSNVWRGPHQHELSLDLMRYSADAPKGVMEALLVHLLVWGKQQGYRRFALGMAPLSGFEDSPLASLWIRLGALLYEHGEAVYSFQGLRAFKEKFGPVWEPRYLAYPGGLRLPHVLADISALIAGGYRRIVLK
jgi:phosphatidylglycerol lysyltransferase